MNNMLMLIAWIFTIGGITGFSVLLLHSLLFYSGERTVFVFLGGTFIAYLLEFTLIHQVGAYSYNQLPLQLIDIPLVIPMGWVVTFYGLLELSQDLLDRLSLNSLRYTALLSGFFALLFGLGIEVIARSSGFWEFHFSSINLLGIPIIVTLAWGLSVTNFTSSVIIFDQLKQKWKSIILLPVVHFINLSIALLLLQLI